MPRTYARRDYTVTPELFWGRVSRGDGCWEWQGARSPAGYGSITYEGRRWHTHRLAWLLSHGTIPDGLFVCHRCDNPACVSPAHLFLGTHTDNMRDMKAKGRGAIRPKPTSCPRGHLYDATDKHGKSMCRTCRAAALRGVPLELRGNYVMRKDRAKCHRGHPRTPENTCVQGGRVRCRECRREIGGAYSERQKRST